MDFINSIFRLRNFIQYDNGLFGSSRMYEAIPELFCTQLAPNTRASSCAKNI